MILYYFKLVNIITMPSVSSTNTCTGREETVHRKQSSLRMSCTRALCNCLCTLMPQCHLPARSWHQVFETEIEDLHTYLHSDYFLWSLFLACTTVKCRPDNTITQISELFTFWLLVTWFLKEIKAEHFENALILFQI